MNSCYFEDDRVHISFNSAFMKAHGYRTQDRVGRNE
jgi:hypothetical protein